MVGWFLSHKFAAELCLSVNKYHFQTYPITSVVIAYNICSLLGYSAHGILQARILEWIATPFSRDLPNPETELVSPALWADS